MNTFNTALASSAALNSLTSNTAFNYALVSTASFNYGSACGVNTVLVFGSHFQPGLHHAVASTAVCSLTLAQLRRSNSLHIRLIYSIAAVTLAVSIATSQQPQ